MIILVPIIFVDMRKQVIVNETNLVRAAKVYHREHE